MHSPPFALTPLALMGWAALLSGGTSCTPTDRPSWRDQLVADSPCYRVDLSDGLDETASTETADLFACLDHHGHLESLRPTVDALHSSTPSGDPGLVAVARMANAMPRAGVDPFALAGVGVDLLRDPEEPLAGLLDLSLELATGTPARDVHSGRVSADDPAVLRSGMLVPLAPIVAPTAQDLLHDDEVLHAIGETLRGPEAARWVRSTASVAASAHPDLRQLTTDLPGHLGDAILATRNGQDGLWVHGTDDSLRDLVTVLTGDGTTPGTIEAVAVPAGHILSDAAIGQDIGELLSDLSDTGDLARLPDELAWLTQTSVSGGVPRRGEPSGLEALARMVSASNRPMVCTLDLGFTDLSVNLGNLSVTLLEVVNDLDPGTVQSGAGILGAALGANISQSLLTSFANTGVCPALTPTLVSDLQVIELLFDDQATSLVRAFLGITRTLEAHGRLDDFVDLLDTLWVTDTVWALGDVLRDTDGEPLWDDIVLGLPILLDPSRAALPTDSIRFEDAWHGLDVLLSDPDIGWSTTAPLLQTAVTHDGTWDAVGTLATLLTDGRSTTSDALALVDRWVQADPDLVLLDTLGTLMADPDVATPLLEVLGSPDAVDALLADVPLASQEQVPVAFWCRLVRTGAVDELLSLVDRLTAALGSGDPT